MRQNTAVPVRVFVAAVLTISVGCSGTPSAPSQTVQAPSSASLTLTGIVRESLADAPGAPIGGVEVQVRYKSGSGPSAMTNTEGRYRIEGITSPNFAIAASKDGFESASAVVLGASAAEVVQELALTPMPRTLAGVVTESVPTETTPIAGARVEILSGTHTGKRASTDGSGRYSLPDLWGEFELAIGRDGYETKTLRVSMAESVTRLNVALLPDDRPTTTVFGGRLCHVINPWDLPGRPSCVGPPLQRHHWLPVHRPGRMTAELNVRYAGDYSFEWTRLEIRCGGAMILEKRFLSTVVSGYPHPLVPALALPERAPRIHVFLAQPCLYEVKVFEYVADHKGMYNQSTEYRLVLEHPK